MGSIAGGLNALGVRRFGLSFVALTLILAIVFWLRPNVASYNGLRLLLNLSPVLVFTALAQMFVMTAGDIDMGAKAWVYRPRRHKTAHHGKDRAILIGPRAQEVLRPFLRVELQAPLFSPAVAVAAQHARMGEHDLALCVGADDMSVAVEREAAELQSPHRLGVAPIDRTNRGLDQGIGGPRYPARAIDNLDAEIKIQLVSAGFAGSGREEAFTEWRVTRICPTGPASA